MDKEFDIIKNTFFFKRCLKLYIYHYYYYYYYYMKYEPCKKSEDNVLANRKFRSCCNIKIVNRLWGKIYAILSIFIELCMKGDSSAGLNKK